MSSVISLFDLATNTFVRHVNLLAAYRGAIPPVLYESLLEASIRTERILSVRQLFVCWPLQKLSLVNCKEFREQHALVMAHSLQLGRNHVLREIDLTGCNIGVRGTKFFLMLVAGRPLPSINTYCSNGSETDKYTVAGESNSQQNRLSITTSCYIDNRNYHLLLDVLDSGMLHNFTVSHFHAIALGRKRIDIVLTELGKVQAEGVIGIDVEMNNFQQFVSNRCNQYFRSFSNLQYLNLSMNKLGLIKLYLLLKNISAPLKHLILNNCKFLLNNEDIGIKMATFPSMQKLEHLEIESNQLREIGGGIMALLLKCAKTLLFLSLEKNCLTDKSVPVIMQLLAAPFALETLRIGENKFSLDAEKLFFSKDKLGIIECYSNDIWLGLTSESKT